MAKKILGLDIQADRISAVVVHTGVKRPVLGGFAHVPRTADEPLDPAAALKELDTREATVVTACPPAGVSLRNLQLPFRDSRKIRQVLPFELEPTLPFAVDAAVTDFLVTHPPAKNEPGDIIAAAVSRSDIDAHVGQLTSAGLPPQVITLGGLVQARCLLRWGDTPGDWLLADMDETHCTLALVVAARLMLVRIIAHKWAAPGGPKALAADIQRTLTACPAQMGLTPDPAMLYVSGTAATVTAEMIARELGQRLDLAAQPLNLLDRLGLFDERSAPPHWRPEVMDRALALALGGTRADTLNFQQDRVSTLQRWREHRATIVRSAALLLVALVLGLVNVHLDAASAKRRIDALDRRIAAVFTAAFPRESVVDALQQMRANVRQAKQSALVSADTVRPIRAIDILNEISTRIAPAMDVNLTRLVIASDNLLVSGDTDTFNTVDDVKGRLEQVPAFLKVTINSANLDKGDQRVRFKLRVEL